MPTATEQLALVAEQVKLMGDRQAAIEAAMKAMGQPVNPGQSPAAVLANMSGTQNTIGGDGARHGTKLHAGIGWGEYLKDLYSASKAGDDSDFSLKLMEKHGAVRVTKAALNEGTGTSGGFTVPPGFAAVLLQLAVEQSFARAMCTAIPMTTRNLIMPALDQSQAPPTNGTAFLGGVVVSASEENADAGETEPAFIDIELVAHEITAYSEISNTLMQDSALTLDSVLTTLLSRALAWYIDYMILRGDGVAKPLGILNAPCTISVNRSTPGSFVLSDAATMISRLVASSWGSAAFVMTQTAIPKLVQLADAGGNVVWIPNFGGDNSAGGGAAKKLPISLFGLPIIFTEKLPALGTRGDVMLCDFSNYLFGERTQMQLDVSPHVQFRKNKTAWRLVSRFDGQPWLKSAITLADSVTTVSPFITLS